MYRKWCRYDLTGDYGIGYTSQEDKFYFDLEDYDLIKDYCWNIQNNGYVVTHCEIAGVNRLMFLHRLIMDVEKTEIVDHINHNKACNRKENLRIVTKSQNSMNQLISTRNKSGTKGVFKNTERQTWIAQIVASGKKISKSFTNKDDAIAHRKFLEVKYHGEYALKESSIA